MRLHAKRWLFLLHRWAGIVLCAFFAMWFISGVVMMYVGYPKLTAAERLARLAPLTGTAASVASPPGSPEAGPLLSPAQALERGGVSGPLSDLRLATASGGAVVYLATPAASPAQPGARRARAGPAVVVDARTGARLTAVDAPWALSSAAAFAGAAAPTGNPPALHHRGTVQEDAFTHSRALDPHRPLHVVDVDDADQTRLYVSGRTGEVVRDATRTERLWNYAGAWIHWLYPFRGNMFDRYWADIVNWLSIAGIVVVLAGTAVGVLRWRFRTPYRSGARTPYPGRMMRWHHVSGLLFATVTLAWIFSGLMSMNPWRIFDSGAPPLETSALQGSPLVIDHALAHPDALLAAARGDVRELRWVRVLGHTWVQAQGVSGAPTMMDALTAEVRQPDPDAIADAARRLVNAPVVHAERLVAYDFYYYTRDAHTMTGGTDKPLPALRLKFGDAHATWVTVDPHTGAVVQRSDRLRRTSRWLFALLHSWDWLPLLERRPVWDVLMIGLSAGGALLSMTAVVIGWRRVGLRFRRRHSVGAIAPPARASRSAETVT